MRHLTVILILCLSAIAHGQISIDDAVARLKEKEASRRAATRPIAPASQPTTRAAWQPRTIVFVIDARGRALSVFSKAHEQLIRAVNFSVARDKCDEWEDMPEPKTPQ